MIPTIQHLHHVTATVADAQPDLDFYTGLLGLRLVKKTVNFDNHFVYHFYYGDERGTPGTIMTTFPYAGTGVRVGRKGTGQITATAFSVPAGSLDRWRTRLEQHSIAVLTDGARFGDRWLGFLDPSSLAIELIESAGDARQPWTGSRVDPAIAIRGVHSVSLTLADPDRSAAFLTDRLGFTIGKTEGNRTRASVGGGGAGHSFDLVRDPAAPAAINGIGTVHHVAMAIGTMEEQLAAREMLLEAGAAVTEVRDRQYFTSIYFREPGGVLYEIATLGPGFAVDEPLSGLGRALKLPPWEEPHRSAIEPRLAPISQP